MDTFISAPSAAHTVPVSVESHQDPALAMAWEAREFLRGRREVEHRFQLDRRGHFCALDDDGRVVGAAACVVYPGETLAWIGGMVVDTAARRRGVARALLRSCVDYARRRGVASIGLDASDQGRPLYAAEGFRSVGDTTRWSGSVRPPRPGSVAVYPASGAELLEMAAFDRVRFGANRAPWLAAVMKDLPHGAFVAYDRQDGRLRGFVLGQERFAGPLVADDAEAAHHLLHATVASGTPPVLHGLDFVPETVRWSREVGLTPTTVREHRMVLGDDLPVRWASQYAVAAWALG
jgi:GNAT superfamily N-acetyltransferase